MFERFTERARQVVVLAQEEARALKHEYIGTEHILLGLLREEEGVAGRVLESLGVTIERVRGEVVRILGIGEGESAGRIPFTQRAKTVLELALREALSLGHNYIGTEHVLLGLISVDEGLGVRILEDFDADPVKVRNEVMRMLSPPGDRAVSQGISTRAQTRHRVDAGWLGELWPVLDQVGTEIRGELGRAPDAGDLLLVLACARGTVPARALDELGVDLDALSDTLQRVRAQTEQARESHAAQRARARPRVPREVLAEIRRRLGISDTGAPPPPG